MRLGYILTTFPCRSETFVEAEIEALRKLGFDITVLAAVNPGDARTDGAHTETLYRPAMFSARAFLSVAYLLVRRPLALGKIACLIIRLLGSCPREALSLMGNLHTIGFFARHVDSRRISQLHAYFLSWPATIGLGLSVATGRQLSISAHARDIFVERGAVELKVSRTRFVSVCTQQGLKYLKSVLSARCHHKLHVCYHGTRTAGACCRLEEGCGPPFACAKFLIAVGRMVEKKGFANLLNAFGLVVRQRPDCRLMIVGDGPQRKRLAALRNRLGLEDCVEFSGWREPEVTRELIRRATALVMPSIVARDGDRDGIPNAILEASDNWPRPLKNCSMTESCPTGFHRPPTKWRRSVSTSPKTREIWLNCLTQ
ncbi:MAG: glycosyltransferase [Planctomycetota bacterium]